MKHERDAFRRVVRRALTRSSNPRDGGFDPTDSRIAHPFATPALPTRSASRRTNDRHPCGYRHAHVSHGARELSLLDPPVAHSTCYHANGSTNQRCVRPTSAHPSNLDGHPDLVGFRVHFAILRWVGPVRTAFHDAVARFGGLGTASSERFLLVEKAELPRHL